jgi:hypothetical protein
MLILGAVGVGTWLELGRADEPVEGPTALSVRAPTMPAPALPEPTADNPRPEIDKARFLFYAIIADVWHGQFRPVYIREHEMKWPEDRWRVFTSPFAFEGIKGEVEVQVFGLHARSLTVGGPPVLDYDSRLALSWQGLGGRGRTTTGLSSHALACLGEVGHSSVPAPSPWSAVPRPPSKLAAFALITRVAEDDPLKEVMIGRLDLLEDAGEHVRGCEDAMRQIFSQLVPGERADGSTPADDLVVASGYWGGPRFKSRLPLPVGLIRHLGTTSLLLLLAAIFLAQLFKRRSLAFAGVLAGVILYAATLDRLVLGAHLRRIADPQTPIASRLTACTGTTCTFFYGRTAHAGLERLGQDESAPAALRTAARSAAAALGTGTDPGFSGP